MQLESEMDTQYLHFSFSQVLLKQKSKSKEMQKEISQGSWTLTNAPLVA